MGGAVSRVADVDGELWFSKSSGYQQIAQCAAVQNERLDSALNIGAAPRVPWPPDGYERGYYGHGCAYCGYPVGN